MIFDTSDSFLKYKGIYPNLDKALDYLSRNNLKELKDGKNVILGDDIYINVVNGKLCEEKDGIFEVHEKYLDIHIDIEGSERILFCDYDSEEITKVYSDEDDYALLKGNKTSDCILDSKHFAVCMTGEPHMPCVKNDDSETVRKAIVKVKVK